MEKLDLQLFSKYKTELMGISAIAIIACHSVVEGVIFPSYLRHILALGNAGVDVFLFLSGMGMYFSLQKKELLSVWYKKRFQRILLPYFFITIPYWMYYSISRNSGFVDFLLNVSTLGYWKSHYGAWYVALLLQLYLFTPIIANFIERFKRRIVISLCIAILIFVLSENVKFSSGNSLLDTIIVNFQLAYRRAPMYILGYAVAPYIKKGIKVSYAWIVLFLLLQIVMAIIPFMCEWQRYWIIAFPIMMISVWIFEKHMQVLSVVCKWFGLISLESYLTNVFISYSLKEIPAISNSDGIFYGNYFYYLLVIVLGLMASVATNKIVLQISKHL